MLQAWTPGPVRLQLANRARSLHPEPSNAMFPARRMPKTGWNVHSQYPHMRGSGPASSGLEARLWWRVSAGVLISITRSYKEGYVLQTQHTWAWTPNFDRRIRLGDGARRRRY